MRIVVIFLIVALSSFYDIINKNSINDSYTQLNIQSYEMYILNYKCKICKNKKGE